MDTGSTDAIDSYRNEHMRSQVWCDEHDREVFARLAAVDWHQQPVANAGKHWATGGVIVGWWRSGGGFFLCLLGGSGLRAPRLIRLRSRF